MAAGSPTTITEVKKKTDNASLVRKTIHAVTYLAPIDTEIPEKLTDDNGQLVELDMTKWRPIGLVSTDGITMGADTDKSEVEALGYVEPVRSDITKVSRTISLTVFETWKRYLLEFVRGVDLSNKQVTTGGELVFDNPQIPQLEEYRMLLVTTDGPAAKEYIQGRCFPRVKLSEIPEEVWSQEDPHGWELTIDVYPDAKLGTSCREYYGGTGAKKDIDILGWKKAMA